MKFNKLIAAMSAVTMLGSLAVAVPASAKTVNGDTGAVTATVSAQVRANDAFVTKNSVAVKTDGTAIEMTQKEGAYFGAYYSFAKSDIPAGATIESATLTITKYDAFKGRSFDVRPVAISDASSTDADTIFSAVADAYANATAVTASETSADNAAPLVADVKNIFDATKANAFFVTNQTVENSKRNLKADATLQVTYTCEEPDDPVAQIGETKYESFQAAFEAAVAGDTIKLLADVETEGRFVLDSGTADAPTYKNNISPLTIDGNGKTITAKAANKYAFLFETNGKTLNLNNITIVNERTYVINAKGSSTINLTDATVPANTLNTNNAGSKVNATNLNVAGAADGVSIFTSGSTLGTVNIALTAALAADYDVVNGVLTAKAAEPATTTEYFTFTGEEGVSYNKVVVNVSGRDDDKTRGTASLGTTISGGSLYIAITGIPEGITITSITLE